jgi:DNA recombination protein RmuC
VPLIAKHVCEWRPSDFGEKVSTAGVAAALDVGAVVGSDVAGLVGVARDPSVDVPVGVPVGEAAGLSVSAAVGFEEPEPKHPDRSRQAPIATTPALAVCLMGHTVTSVVGGPWDGGPMNVMSELVVLLIGLALGVLLGGLLGVLWARSRPSYVGGLGQGMVDQAEVMQGLDRLSDQLHDFEHARATWQGQLHQQVLDMRHTADGLRRETQSLSTALRRPQVRGRWGELHLRRAVELAGLVDRCDFHEQVRLADGSQRPDLVVRLAGGRSVVVDAKVPLDAFLDATSTDDPDQREAQLARHARQLRSHIELLGSKRYWRSLPETPEFVVLFLPAESFLAAGLDADGSLIEYAAERGVVLASPTTLIALLRTVAHGWRHESLADQAREIHRVGRDLHDRLRTMGTHLGKLGRSLDTAVGAYNQTVGSWESRVLVAARRFEDLDATDDLLGSPPRIETAARAVGSVHPLPRRAADDEEVAEHTVAP